MCGSYSRSGKSACTIHSIYENVLTQIVLEDIREKARCAAYDRDRLLAQIIRMKDKEQHSRAASYEQELKVTAARVAELEKLMQNLYEDKCTGVVTPTVFQTLMKKYETERAQKAAALPELEQKVRAQLENRHDASNSAKARNYVPADESVSIENQRELLSKFAMLNGWVETKTYCDDGYSGGNFQRPGFLEMLEDARNGVINLILVKDLFRLGRDFVEVGRYTDV